jgi:hypothetical protein
MGSASVRGAVAITVDDRTLRKTIKGRRKRCNHELIRLVELSKPATLARYLVIYDDTDNSAKTCTISLAACIKKLHCVG